MYAKIFRQVFDSSLADNPEAMRVFIYMCVLADQDGVVDMTSRSISQTTRIPLDEIERQIRNLMQPDPTSRSPKEKGARLVLVDPHNRDWGWRIVNFKHYGSLQSEQDRRSHFRGKRRCRRSQFIYYARSGGVVKIGLTVNPAARIAKLKVNRPDVELAAKELGSEELLRRRCSEFANEQICKCWFRISAKIRDHLSRLAAGDLRSQNSNGNATVAQSSVEVAEGSNSSINASAIPRGKRKNGVPAGSTWVTDGSAKKACTELEANICVPPTVPLLRGQRDQLDFRTAKAFLHHLFGRRNRNWSAEENQLLVQITPINAADAELIRIWFALPSSHPVFQQTKRKQELTTFLRDFNGELDKIRRFAHMLRSRDAEPEKEEPELWREVLRWKYDPTVRLPASFWKLPDDLRQEYFDSIESYTQAVHPT